MEAPSSFWNAFTLQPGSTTITLSGRRSNSAPRLRMAAMMRLAWSRVMTVIYLVLHFAGTHLPGKVRVRAANTIYRP